MRMKLFRPWSKFELSVNTIKSIYSVGTDTERTYYININYILIWHAHNNAGDKTYNKRKITAHSIEVYLL